MKRIDPFIWDDAIKEKRHEKYLDRLDRGKNIRNLFLVVFPSNEKHLLSILSCREFFREDRRGNVTVVGASKSHEGAKELVRSIVARTYDNRGDISRDILEKELLGEKELD